MYSKLYLNSSTTMEATEWCSCGLKRVQSLVRIGIRDVSYDFCNNKLFDEYQIIRANPLDFSFLNSQNIIPVSYYF